jgi:hypothetical protein
MSCDNLCTAQECAELEQRIAKLEIDLDILKAAFEAHDAQSIPQAHEYGPLPYVKFYIDYNNNRIELELKAYVDLEINLHEQKPIPNAHYYKHQSNLKIDGSFSANYLYLTVADGDTSDTATILIPIPDNDHQVTIGAAVSSQTLGISVMVNGVQDSTAVRLPDFDPSVQVDCDIYQGTLAVNVQVDDSSDIGFVDLPILKGDKGDQGEKGEPGERGFKGFAGTDGRDGRDGRDGIDGEDGRDGIDGKDGRDGIDGIGIDGCAINLDYIDNKLSASLSVGGCNSFDEVAIVEFATIDVEQVDCVDGEVVSEIIQVAVLKGTQAAELEKYAATAKMLKAQCLLEPVAAAPDWWQVRLGANRPQIVCVFRKSQSRTYHSLTIPHPKNVELPTEEILPAYQKGNFQGMIVLADNSKFIVNCISAGEAERMCNIAASKIIGSYLPNPFKIWITERKGEPVGESNMKPSSILYFSQGQKNLKPDWRFAIPPDLEPS